VKSRYAAHAVRRLATAVQAGFGLALIGALAACSQPVPQSAAQEPDSDTVCTLDGMTLVDYPGPKAQIHYAEGQPDFYCDLIELFASLAAPEKLRKISALFVQDMGVADWERPTGSWIDAKAAIYVAGSRKQGSMGPTLGSFSSMADAEAFVRKEGGKVLRYEQILNDPGLLQSADSHQHKAK
jgi:copper chaperone NosL